MTELDRNSCERHRAERAEARLGRIAALCDEAEANRWNYPEDNGLTPLATYKLRAILGSEAVS